MHGLFYFITGHLQCLVAAVQFIHSVSRGISSAVVAVQGGFLPDLSPEHVLHGR